ncbi:MAG: PASTA domain-containing protein [Lachnospiraceae bacterium]|nr:PASTA domain-containing protein [Lachnospiraceae bacterium]
MSKLCLGCMKLIENDDVKCPYCDFDQNSRQNLPFLQLGSKLQNDRYLVGKRLSSNNESTKYLGFDSQSESPVIIREFLPNGLCARGKSSSKIVVPSDKVTVYKRLQNKFLDYNRTLARLKDCSAVCTVYDIFTENNTAYTVEEPEELISFTEYIKRSGGHLEWDMARPLFLPLLSTIEAMHRNGISHYGIGPGNVKISSNGKIKLQNFAISDIRRVGTDMRPQLITGCSAPEQYDKYSMLNESTEIYGFTATLFYALTGSVPESVEKRKQDNRLLISTGVNKRLPPHIRTALSGGLQFDQDKRIQSFEELKAQLSAAPTVKAIQEEISRPNLDDDDEDERPEKKKKSKKKKRGSRIYGVIAGIVSLVLFVFVGTSWLESNPFEKWFQPDNVSSDSDDEALTGDLVTVPNLVGVKYELAVDDAEKTSDYKLLKAVEEEFSDDIPEGYIASQFPEAYSEEMQGYSLYITVSKGAKMRSLPEIEGKTVDQVAQLLGDESFITTQDFKYDDKIKKGLVIGYEAHTAGDKLEYGSSVVIIVSRGPEEKPNDSDSDSDSDNSSDGLALDLREPTAD